MHMHAKEAIPSMVMDRSISVYLHNSQNKFAPLGVSFLKLPQFAVEIMPPKPQVVSCFFHAFALALSC